MRRSPWINLILFILTLFSTMIVGAMHSGADIFSDPLKIYKGLPFSLMLLSILLVHEFGHYIMSRRHGVMASLPYFIPFPSLFGTLGAVIRMKSPITTRDALIDIGASGPIAGFIVSLIAVISGLSISKIGNIPHSGEVIVLGDSLLFKFLTELILGPIPPHIDILLHPIALAGWIGLFVTSINLFPVGQLDGGHITYALFGRWHRKLSVIMITLFIIAGILPMLISGKIEVNNWLIWGGLLMVLGPDHPPILYPWVPLHPARKLLGILSLIVLMITFVPIPIQLK